MFQVIKLTIGSVIARIRGSELYCIQTIGAIVIKKGSQRIGSRKHPAVAGKLQPS
jgi:hypothetical protein